MESVSIHILVVPLGKILYTENTTVYWKQYYLLLFLKVNYFIFQEVCTCVQNYIFIIICLPYSSLQMPGFWKRTITGTLIHVQTFWSPVTIILVRNLSLGNYLYRSPRWKFHLRGDWVPNYRPLWPQGNLPKVLICFDQPEAETQVWADFNWNFLLQKHRTQWVCLLLLSFTHCSQFGWK